jgi:hypothetical protein
MVSLNTHISYLSAHISLLISHVSTLNAQRSTLYAQRSTLNAQRSTLYALRSNLITHPGINDGHIRDRMKTPGFMFSYLAYYENIIIYICNKSKNEDRRF